MTYSSFIKLKCCFKRVMQNVVALIKLTKEVCLVCFCGLYIGWLGSCALVPSQYLSFTSLKHLLLSLLWWPLIFSYSESHKSRRIVM